MVDFIYSYIANNPSYKHMENILKAVDLVKDFNQAQWNEFSRLIRKYNKSWLDNYENPITTHDDAKELQQLLIKDIIEFIQKRNLTDIDEVYFSADCLQQSVKYNKWVPETDSSISLIGLQHEDNIDFLVRRIITENY